MKNTSLEIQDFSLAYYSGDRKTGSIDIVSYTDGKTAIKQLETEPESSLDKQLKPVFVGLTEKNEVILLDPESKDLLIQSRFPEDAFPAHIYSDPTSDCDWFMNDGDKESGNDTLNCGTTGSSVTVVKNTASSNARYLSTICVGRGHHQATFTFPTERHPEIPRQAYISNLKDGSISVIGNDPSAPETYLKVIATIDLCESDREKNGEQGIPNNSFPHGIAYSGYTGKIYNLNNGYGTVAIIDPVSNLIEDRIVFKGHSNLFIAPGGRYIIGRGADRKSDDKHVIAKLTVLDLSDNKIVGSVSLPDIYISKYYFNPEGSKLYLTTSSSGSPDQQANIKPNVLLVFNISALPDIRMLAEIDMGAPSGAIDFQTVNGQTQLVFSSNSEAGEIAVISGQDESIIEKIKMTGKNSHSRLWMLDHRSR